MAAFSPNIFVTIVSFFRAACQVFNILPLINVAIDIEVCDPVVPNLKLSHFITGCLFFACVQFTLYYDTRLSCTPPQRRYK
ncbi:hypothetical protein J3R83DRAFT_1685 [Lanmaoa asiatica]|nr:hypothetical protein J3R83DRAFT_1685 [Lanmaoa asiatica]